MKRITPLILALFAAPAYAGPDDDDDDAAIESVSGKELPPIESGRGRPRPGGTVQGNKPPSRGGDSDAMTAEEWREYNAREFKENLVYKGAEWLDLQPAYVNGVRDGLVLVYERDYKGARKHFEKLDTDIPGTGISAVADTVVWQALMLENFDFRYDKQYQVSSKQAISELEAALNKPGQDGWEHFLMAGMMGIEAIHTVRHSQYLGALQRAFDAMDHAAKAKEAAPDFRDLLLADGMYNYWRTVITMSSSVLPDFGDHRAEGIEQMRAVEDGGVFLKEPATLSLAFSYIEERDYKQAITACHRNGRMYPDSVINNMLTGQTYLLMRRFDSAVESFDKIFAVAPDNNRGHYWKGVALMRSGKAPEAEKEFRRYLESDHLEDHQRSASHYRLGQTLYRQKKYDAAQDEYKAAVKIDGYKPAKNALARMKQLKKQGKLD